MIYKKSKKKSQKRVKYILEKYWKVGKKMYLIVGLGNPEQEYSNTRHNMGFDTVNKLAKQYEIEINKKKFKGVYGTGNIEGEKVIILKPQTYMNLSGESIKEAIDFYKIEGKNIIIIYDDIDIKPGIIKVRKTGGPGTHNGMKSVIQNIQMKEFPRVRVGIGMPEHKNDLINYVIGKIPKEEIEILDKSTTKAKEAVIEIIKNGINRAMNKFN